MRKALKVIPPERLMLSSDCGMGREGMSRRHAFYKMVALVQGTNIVKKELGLPETESLGRRPEVLAASASIRNWDGWDRYDGCGQGSYLSYLSHQSYLSKLEPGLNPPRSVR